ncbi:hypothetical protein D3C73_1299890 [compost metagenome]
MHLIVQFLFHRQCTQGLGNSESRARHNVNEGMWIIRRTVVVPEIQVEIVGFQTLDLYGQFQPSKVNFHPKLAPFSLNGFSHCFLNRVCFVKNHLKFKGLTIFLPYCTSCWQLPAGFIEQCFGFLHVICDWFQVYIGVWIVFGQYCVGWFFQTGSDSFNHRFLVKALL